MKKFFLAAAIVASLCFVGCSSDDDSAGGSSTDCFSCTFFGETQEYCHTGDDDFYTVTYEDGETEDVELSGVDWDDAKEALSMLCE
ncbi:hypothetical protein [Neptunitalea lumnitzerae]|uniref:Uncharacterized protein n=1 Tax=Neptunitalea lumnitzerae TaxID=2965509 RepID=A0ABQ5MME9_9FLAO|nr:hypothetical protein [Neptunitalea sp. Y10]GLB50559.1 hypothetical protein Y10_29270 [Neptunitalea sp. Y10]